MSTVSIKSKNPLFLAKQLLTASFWRCTFKYVKGLKHYEKDRYQQAIDCFTWIIDNGGMTSVKHLLYKMIGICYARMFDLDKAGKYLVMAMAYPQLKNDGELFMWIGYLYLTKENYPESMKYFQRALQLGQKGIYKRLVKQRYIRERIADIDKILREKYSMIIEE